ncbi:hypothetical protein FQN60_003856, partial [Etheostoma spectabile]
QPKRGPEKAAVVLEEEQRQALSQEKGIQAHLEQRTVLTKTLAQMTKLSRVKLMTFCRSAHSGRVEWQMYACLVCTAVNHMDHLTSHVQEVADATQELCVLIFSSYKEKLTCICK